jgi:uncharacterized protein (DUF1501 family)
MLARRTCTGPLPRRAFLRAGCLALGGITLADVLAARAAAGETTRDTSVILLYLHGGPSHLETYDLKPEAPLEYRSIFRPICTNVAGMDLCEHFPLQARLADKLALVRSVHHEMSSHSDGGIEVLTGKTPTRPDPTSTSRSEHPDLGHVASRLRGLHADGLPQYVALPQRLYMTQPAYLGLAHSAFAAGDPSNPSYAPPNLQLVAGVDGSRLDDRRALLEQFDRLRRGLDVQGSLEAMDRFRATAMQMLTSSAAAAAFDLSREEDALRDRYGRHLWGQACLLARRLAEAGTAVITIYIDTPRTGQEFTNWDDHILNAGRPGHFGRYMEIRLPYFDQALSALVEDIYARGVDRQIMVVALGEFGRTPRLSQNSQGVGRDHWPQAQSVLFAGGGLKTGQVVGATNRKGEYPTSRPLSPKDVLATIYRHLGIDLRHELHDFSGRPIPVLPWGEPIAELV